MSVYFAAWLAYIDPGTGSLILQTLIAGALGALVFFRSAIARLFGRGKSPEADDGEAKPVAKTGEAKTNPLKFDAK